MMKDSLKKSLERRLDKGRKQGFTLVELLVVIAIIAVLATVSVVGYLGFTKKAKVSNDISLTTQMNTALDANRAISKNNTMTDAVEDLADAGLDVEKLSPTADGYSYVWDMKQDLMFLLDEKKNVVAPSDKTISPKNDVFAVIHSDTQKNDWSAYAQYIAADYPEQSIEYTVLTSVDTGKSDVKDVSITGETEGTSVIRMNGGTLTFADEKADAKFYGKADKVVINKVKDASFHVYGEVSTVELESGRVVLESGSTTGSVVATGTEAKLTTNKGAELGGVGYKTDTKPAGITASDAVKVDAATYDKFAGGLGTEKSPYLVSNPSQFTNIGEFYKDKKEGTPFNGKTDYYFKQINHLVLTGNNLLSNFSGTYDGNGFSISYDNSVEKTWGSLFNCAFKTVTIKNLTHCLKAKQAISLINQNPWDSDSLDLTFQNVTIDSNGETVIANGNNFGLFASQTMYMMKGARFIDCTNKANLNNSGTSTGVFLGSGWYFDYGIVENGKFNVEYKNCVNYGNITGSSNVGVLYGNGAYVGYYDTEYEKDADGNFVLNSKGEKKEVTTRVKNDEYPKERFSVENVRNEGYIKSLLKNGGVAQMAPNATELSSTVTFNENSLNVGGVFNDSKSIKANLNSAGNFVVYNDHHNDKVDYKIAFTVLSIKNKTPEDGKVSYSNTDKFFVEAELDNSLTTSLIAKNFKAVSKKYATQNSISFIKNYNDSVFVGLGKKDNITYLIFDEDNMNGRTIEGTKKVKDENEKEQIVPTYVVDVSISLFAYQGSELVGNYKF